MPITAALIAVGGSVLTSLMGPDGGGAGGGVSAKTQGGASEVPFTPVGLETLQISPFEYMQQEFNQEQAQNMQYGGPLYRGKGGDIATDIFSQGIKDMMPSEGIGGILSLLLASNFLDNEDDEEEKSIVPGVAKTGGPLYAADGEPIEGEPLTPEEEKRNQERMLMIMSMLGRNRGPQTYTSLSAPMGGKSFNDQDQGIPSLDEEIPQIEVEGEAPVKTPSQMSDDLMIQLDDMLQLNKRNDALTKGGSDVIKAYLSNRNQKSSVKGRGNIVPGSGGGGRANRQQRQKTASQGITPFQYKEMQGGGTLDRKMFMQNQMPNGGDIRGPGGPKDDLIPVMASNGEYMLSKAAVDQAGGGNHSKGIANLEQFNNMGNRRYGR